jgi:predicted  nucleic acid-binding Zn-ribbon protein
MVDKEKLKQHIDKARKKLKEDGKSEGDVKTSPKLRKLKKKVKRLTRKASKFAFAAKMLERRKVKKKDRAAPGATATPAS